MNAALYIEAGDDIGFLARQQAGQLHALSYLEFSRRHRNRQRAIRVLAVMAALAVVGLILSEVL